MVAGAMVVDRIRTRSDQAGALVYLENGSLAVTGASLAVGDPGLVRRYADMRLAVAADRPEQGWWRDVIASLPR
jgi:hypothetical protein